MNCDGCGKPGPESREHSGTVIFTCQECQQEKWNSIARQAAIEERKEKQEREALAYQLVRSQEKATRELAGLPSLVSHGMELIDSRLRSIEFVLNQILEQLNQR
jgi:hypothetical protein